MKNLFKCLMLAVASLAIASCKGVSGDDGYIGGESSLKIVADKNLIQSNGQDYATLEVTLNGEKVTDNVSFYDDKDNLLDIDDFKFSTERPGVHKIWASYGVEISDAIEIIATAVPIPATPSDPAPASTDFKARVLCLQFTGTGCSYCTEFMGRLKNVMENRDSDDYVWAAAHTYPYSTDDPAQLSWDWPEKVFSVTHPSVVLDYRHTYFYYQTVTSETDFMSYVNKFKADKEGVAAGIAVNASMADDQIVAKVTVKAAEDAAYRVVALLLEDGLKGSQTQTVAGDWRNTHNSCIRYVDGKYSTGAAGDQYYGYSLGEIKKGQTADYLFVWTLDEIWNNHNASDKDNLWDKWVASNLRMAVYVTTITKNADGEEVYYVNNAVNASVNGETPFEYNK